MDNTKRFSDRVDMYVKYRPSYPAEAIDFLYDKVGFSTSSVIADIGAGTGKFSKLLLDRGSSIMAVEPNKEMRESALLELGGQAGYRAVPGTAEQTELADQSVDFIVCAQAFHWFDRVAARQEFRRILRPGGKAVLIWNSRLTEGTPFREEYDQLLHRYGVDYHKLKHKNISPADLAAFYHPEPMQEARFVYGQSFDFDGLCGRMKSSSYIPLPGDPAYEPMMQELQAIFARNEQDGQVPFEYETEVYWGEL
ncbi:class I SAM-dependent methyltransferase [Paenibacillus kobensis]|uniref:class I SAM-dependent methyltransferase n=1 Tax=Paenibacillus kobensis TaxID=59841 RepID=UPI000FD94A72|nr:class I SAM-dependent methyltransferase [Paenibacillus kobensis]